MRLLRSWIAGIFQIRDEAAQGGEWWEIDLLIVLILGSLAAGALAWLQM